MSEWLKEHAGKAIPVIAAKPDGSTSLRSRLKDLAKTMFLDLQP
jgi:hypothetical protein